MSSDEISADTIRRAIERIRENTVRACPHLIPPGVDVVWGGDLDGTEYNLPCAALCGAVLTVRPRKPTVVELADAEPISMERLLRIYDEFQYKRVPCEGRLTAEALRELRKRYAPDPTKDAPVAAPYGMLAGIRLIVDPEIEPNVIEFRDADGNVIHRITL